MALSAEYRTKFAALHQQALATPYEWRILKRDVKQFTINTEQMCAFFSSQCAQVSSVAHRPVVFSEK